MKKMCDLDLSIIYSQLENINSEFNYCFYQDKIGHLLSKNCEFGGPKPEISGLDLGARFNDVTLHRKNC